jgi:hypothetical protein
MHNCSGYTAYDIAGHAVEYCQERDGELWVGNSEYESQVNYRPYCGFKATVKAEINLDI